MASDDLTAADLERKEARERSYCAACGDDAPVLNAGLCSACAVVVPLPHKCDLCGGLTDAPHGLCRLCSEEVIRQFEGWIEGR